MNVNWKIQVMGYKADVISLFLPLYYYLELVAYWFELQTIQDQSVKQATNTSLFMIVDRNNSLKTKRNTRSYTGLTIIDALLERLNLKIANTICNQEIAALLAST